MIKFSGPLFQSVDNRLMSLQLVSQGLTNAVMFKADGETVQPAEVFYKKAIPVERGSFRPVTYATNDMLDGARRVFLAQCDCSEDEVLVLMEMTLEICSLTVRLITPIFSLGWTFSVRWDEPC